RGRDLDLWQRNTVIAVPVFVSSAGYGIVWDQNARTRFGDVREPELLSGANMIDADGVPGALTATYFADGAFENVVAVRRESSINVAIAPAEKEHNQRLHPALPASGPVSVRWTGSVVMNATGPHTLQPFFSSGLKVWIDDELV